VPHRIILNWYTGRWWMGCYIWYSEEGTGRDPSPPRPLLAVPNVTAHPSTASVPITVLLYNGPLLNLLYKTVNHNTNNITQRLAPFFTCGNASCKHAMLINAQALRSHSRCWLVSSEEMSPCASRSLTSVTDRRLILTCQPRRTTTTRKIFASSVERWVVDNKNGWTYQKAEFIDNHFSPQYNRFSCFLL